MTTKTRKLGKPVAFRCQRLNLRLQVSGALSESQDPAAATHPDVKMAIFRDGVFQTDDPSTIAVLDAHPEVWRLGDPDADLKAEFGPKDYERLRAKFAQVEDPPQGEQDPESDASPATGDEEE